VRKGTATMTQQYWMLRRSRAAARAEDTMVAFQSSILDVRSFDVQLDDNHHLTLAY
jgi:hypothetical protein